jgi:hypothetical protein
LSDLHDAGNTNSPVNDMEPLGLPPLSEAHARGLGELLLTYEELKFTPDVPSALADATDGLPFFIHRICAMLQNSYVSLIGVDDVVQAREALLQDPADPMQFSWYEERIENYYDAQAELAFALLDAIAVSENPIPYAELLNQARHKLPEARDQEVRTTLRHLMQDHYLSEAGGKFRFQFSIIRDAWRIRRWLGE